MPVRCLPSSCALKYGLWSQTKALAAMNHRPRSADLKSVTTALTDLADAELDALFATVDDCPQFYGDPVLAVIA